MGEATLADDPSCGRPEAPVAAGARVFEAPAVGSKCPVDRSLRPAPWRVVLPGYPAPVGGQTVAPAAAGGGRAGTGARVPGAGVVAAALTALVVPTTPPTALAATPMPTGTPTASSTPTATASPTTAATATPL